MKPEHLQMLVGNNIRYYRIQAGLTQEDLATRAGINRSYLSDLERGARNVRLSTLALLSETLGVQPCQLLTERLREEHGEKVD